MMSRRLRRRSVDTGDVQTASDRVVERLRAAGRPRDVEAMARYGIRSARAFGVRAPVLHAMARELGHDQDLARALWATEIHDARVLACLVSEPARFSRREMDAWTRAFDNWAVCDAACLYAFSGAPAAWDKARQWSCRRGEFVRRAGLALMASLAVHDRAATPAEFGSLLPFAAAAADDPRPIVRKAASWALRQVGKRHPALRAEALRLASRLRRAADSGARWVGADVTRELRRGEGEKQPGRRGPGSKSGRARRARVRRGTLIAPRRSTPGR